VALALSHDGLWVGGEFSTAGTRSASSLSVWHALTLAPPRIIGSRLSSAGCRIDFTTLAHLHYSAEFSHDLTSTNWTVLEGEVPGTGGIVAVTDHAATNWNVGFYRVGLQP
jgi:hypothetical protein